MSKAELRKLVVEMADYLLSVADQLHYQEEPDYAKAAEELRFTNPPADWSAASQVKPDPKWGPGRVKGNLTNRQGIQWPLDKLDERMRAEIAEDDASLLDKMGE